MWPKAVDAPPGAEGLLRHRASLARRPAVRLTGFPAPAGQAGARRRQAHLHHREPGQFPDRAGIDRGRLDALGLHVRADWPWVPMDGARLPDLLVTFGLQEMMFGARYLTAHSSQAIERCRVGGGFVPLWRGTLRRRHRWTFLWHPVRRDRRASSTARAGTGAGRRGRARCGSTWASPAPNPRPHPSRGAGASRISAPAAPLAAYSGQSLAINVHVDAQSASPAPIGDFGHRRKTRARFRAPSCTT